MPQSTLPEWATSFHPFTWVHGLSVIWLVGSIVIACRLGRRWLRIGRTDLEQRLASAWGGFAIGVNAWSIIYWHLPGTFKLDESLPIQLCDLACMLAPIVLLAEWRWARALLFFWGIGLSTQAFVTPTLLDGPAHMKFYLFWFVHLAIVGTAVYDAVVRRFRPNFRDLLLTIAVGIVYILAMVVVNHLLDSNYGFVGNQLRDTPTLVDKLGPWPMRIFVITGIAIALFCIMWLVSTWIERATARDSGPGGGGRSARNQRPLILHCSKCGFDLADSKRTDHCPECGTPITPPGV